MAAKKTLLIKWSDYSDETNDSSERATAKELGPLNPDGSGIRIPYDGFEDEQYIYRLIGWPKSLKAPPVTLDRDVVAWLQKHLGKGYQILQRDSGLQRALASQIAARGWKAIQRDWTVGRNERELGPVQALQYALSPDTKPAENTRPPDRPMAPARAIPAKFSDSENFEELGQ